MEADIWLLFGFSKCVVYIPSLLALSLAEVEGAVVISFEAREAVEDVSPVTYVFGCEIQARLALTILPISMATSWSWK